MNQECDRLPSALSNSIGRLIRTGSSARPAFDVCPSNRPSKPSPSPDFFDGSADVPSFSFFGGGGILRQPRAIPHSSSDYIYLISHSDSVASTKVLPAPSSGRSCSILLPPPFPLLSSPFLATCKCQALVTPNSYPVFSQSPIELPTSPLNTSTPSVEPHHS